VCKCRKNTHIQGNTHTRGTHTQGVHTHTQEGHTHARGTHTQGAGHTHTHKRGTHAKLDVKTCEHTSTDQQQRCVAEWIPRTVVTTYGEVSRIRGDHTGSHQPWVSPAVGITCHGYHPPHECNDVRSSECASVRGDSPKLKKSTFGVRPRRRGPHQAVPSWKTRNKDGQNHPNFSTHHPPTHPILHSLRKPRESSAWRQNITRHVSNCSQAIQHIKGLGSEGEQTSRVTITNIKECNHKDA
jgi:hypothetical protein